MIKNLNSKVDGKFIFIWQLLEINKNTLRHREAFLLVISAIELSYKILWMWITYPWCWPQNIECFSIQTQTHRSQPKWSAQFLPKTLFILQKKRLGLIFVKNKQTTVSNDWHGDLRGFQKDKLFFPFLFVLLIDQNSKRNSVSLKILVFFRVLWKVHKCII